MRASHAMMRFGRTAPQMGCILRRLARAARARACRGALLVLFLICASLAIAAQTALAQPSITEFSNGITSGSSPVSIASAPDGNLWFANQTADVVGRITPAGVVTEFPAPSGSDGITPGPDGNLWSTTGDTQSIRRVTLTGGPTDFASGVSGITYGITEGPDGNMWFTEPNNNLIGKITPSGTVTEFPLPTPNGGPFELAAGPDGALWFTEQSANKIGRITTAGVVTNEFPVQTAGSSPSGIAQGPDGSLWFTENTANKIGRITAAGVITEFQIPTANSYPTGIAAGPDGALWFTESSGNKIGRVTTAGTITEEIPVPTLGSAPFGITTGPDGNVWFTEVFGNQIGRVDLNGGACPVKLVPGGFPPLRTVLSKTANFTKAIANIGLMEIGVYANVSLANAYVCLTPNVTVDALGIGGWSSLNPYIDLTAHNTGPGVNLTKRNFIYYLRSGWNYTPGSYTWSLAPPNQLFQLDWGTFAVHPSPANLSYSQSDDSRPIISADLADITGPTLTIQEMADVAHTIGLSTAMEPGANVGVTLSPSNIVSSCYLEALSDKLQLRIPSYDRLLAKGYVNTADQRTFDTALQIVQLLRNMKKTADSVATEIRRTIDQYVRRACLSGVQQAEQDVALRGLAVARAPVVAAIRTDGLTGTLVTVTLRQASAGAVAIGDVRGRAVGAISAPAAAPLKRLRLGRLRISSGHGVRTAPLSRAEVVPLVPELEPLRSAAKVGRLIVSGTFKAGGRIAVLGARLPDLAPHRAMLIVRGPGYEGEAVLVERGGLAGAVLTLPRTVRRGIWAIAIVDTTAVRLVRTGSHVRGWSEIRLGVFHVARTTHV